MREHRSTLAGLHICTSLLAALWLISFASAARAQVDQRFRPPNGYWSEGTPRFFVSQRSEAGTPYAKPYISAGYGLPHWLWTGIDVNAIATLEMFQTYFGVHGSLPVFDLQIGMRDTWSYGKPFLTPDTSYTRTEVLNPRGPRARYWALEAEAVGILPLPHAAFIADVIMVRTLDVPKNMYLYEESYRAVIADPLYFTVRLAALGRLLRENSLRIGVLSEYVLGAGRDRMTVRVGPAGSLQVTDHLEINAALTLAVVSPDRMGLALGAYGVAGVRYRWASGERNPSWPWQGYLIP
jgi:hypothetical protein